MFIDANIFITAFLSAGQKGKNIEHFFSRIKSGEQKATTSPLVMDEVFHVISNKQDYEYATSVWKKMLSMPNLTLLPVDAKAASFFLEFSSQGLEPRDALHVATMKAHGILTICSYDKAFDIISSIKRQEPK